MRGTAEPKAAWCSVSSLEMPPRALNSAPDGLPRVGVGGSPAGGRQMWWKDQSPRQMVDREAWVMGSGDSREEIQGSFHAVGAEGPARTCPCSPAGSALTGCCSPAHCPSSACVGIPSAWRGSRGTSLGVPGLDAGGCTRAAVSNGCTPAPLRSGVPHRGLVKMRK